MVFYANDQLEKVVKGRYKEEYIILEETTEHPDLLIAKNRLSYDVEVEKAAKKLGLNLQNNSQGYIGEINYKQSLDINTELGNFTLNPKLFTEFLKLLKSGRALEGKGTQVNSSELENILNEIIEVRGPYRAEWLDHKYSSQSKGLFKGKEMCVTYHKFDSSGNLVEFTEPLDEDTLMKNKIPGISLDDWVNHPTSQGLPIKTVKEGDLYFWKPIEGRVTGLIAGAGWAGLVCVGDASNSNANLGVRSTKILGGKP